MSLLFIDGFDHYVTADFTKKWNSTNNSPTIGTTSGRRGGGAFVCAGGSKYLTKTLAASSSWVIGFAYKPTTLPSSQGSLIWILDAGTPQCALNLNPDGTLAVVRSTGTAVTDGTSVFALAVDTFYYIEFKVTIADSISAGTCKVRINGVDVITVATSQDLKATANTTANSFWIGTVSSSSGQGIVDDLYVCDGAGSTNNDFLGDVRVDTLYPTSDGNYSQFTCSTGSSHFALVDETAPNTSDYNIGSTVSDRDSYGMGNLTPLTSQTVYGVQVNAALLKDDAGSKSVATFVRSNTTNSDGASVPLGTSQIYVSQVFETNPDGAVAWTETTVNAMEAGVKVTA
jgi:hypothetical protein